MMSSRAIRGSRTVESDMLLVALAVVHGCLLIVWPSIPLVAIGLWWNANTISHNFIHRPFFRARLANEAFSCYLSLLLGLPQSLWRARHLTHHLSQGDRQTRRRFALSPLDFVAAICLWGGLGLFAPRFALFLYAPGFLLGLMLCYLQGHYEHVRGTVSHYGKLYNFLFFNDGYHAEHHARPGAHWRELCRQRAISCDKSRWPATLRWLECVNLCALERLVIRFSRLQRFVLDRHQRATARLIAGLDNINRVGIVGGGLFPRTAIILNRLLPGAGLSIIEMDSKNIAISRRFLLGPVDYVSERFDAESRCDYELLVIPLAFVGDRDAIYRRPPARVVLVHDWIWHRRGEGVVVSWLLLKRLNLVKR